MLSLKAPLAFSKLWATLVEEEEIWQLIENNKILYINCLLARKEAKIIASRACEIEKIEWFEQEAELTSRERKVFLKGLGLAVGSHSK